MNKKPYEKFDEVIQVRKPVAILIPVSKIWRWVKKWREKK